MDYLLRAKEIEAEPDTIRQTLHRHPEMGNKEVFTSAFIADYLKGLGIEVHRMLETAVVGILRGGKPGRKAALRADMDALPVTEETGCSFASEIPGVMHACGHDIHVTSALGAAKLLSEHRDARYTVFCTHGAVLTTGTRAKRRWFFLGGPQYDAKGRAMSAEFGKVHPESVGPAPAKPL